MKKTLLGLSFVVMVLMLGFGSIALLTRLSEIVEDPVASQEDSGLTEIAEIDEVAFEFNPKDCLTDEQWDSEAKECYYECDTDAECAEIEEKLDAELEELYVGSKTSLSKSFESKPSGESTVYSINNGFIKPIDGGETDPQDQELWDTFLLIASKDFISQNLIRFEVSDNLDSETGAYVSPFEDNPSLWVLGFNKDASHGQGSFDREETITTLIHEFAHVMTLQASQVPPDVSFNSGGQLSCETFFTGEGCSISKAYINQFYSDFWKDIYDADLVESDDEEAIAAFYAKYQERFVTEYAATNPGEDIAESFAVYILRAKPEGDSIADKKIQFFYEFEELVKLREQMRKRLAK